MCSKFHIDDFKTVGGVLNTTILHKQTNRPTPVQHPLLISLIGGKCIITKLFVFDTHKICHLLTILMAVSFTFLKSLFISRSTWSSTVPTCIGFRYLRTCCKSLWNAPNASCKCKNNTYSLN